MKSSLPTPISEPKVSTLATSPLASSRSLRFIIQQELEPLFLAANESVEGPPVYWTPSPFRARRFDSYDAAFQRLCTLQSLGLLPLHTFITAVPA